LLRLSPPDDSPKAVFTKLFTTNNEQPQLEPLSFPSRKEI
jgi:hypothetical protein